MRICARFVKTPSTLAITAARGAATWQRRGAGARRAPGAGLAVDAEGVEAHAEWRAPACHAHDGAGACLVDGARAPTPEHAFALPGRGVTAVLFCVARGGCWLLAPVVGVQLGIGVDAADAVVVEEDAVHHTHLIRVEAKKRA